MKSINVIKILEEQEKIKAKERKSTDVAMLLKDKIWNYIENFIMPNILKQIEIDEKAQAHYEDILFELLISHNDFTKEDNNMFTEEEINVLNTSDRKVKVNVGKMYAEQIIRLHTKQDKINEFQTRYVIPMLKELNEQDVIIYDTNALDNKTKSATNKIDKLVNKIINDKASENCSFALFKRFYGNDYIEKNDIIYNDDKEQKIKFTNCIKSYIEKNYNNIDYKSIEDVNFAEMQEFKLD